MATSLEIKAAAIAAAIRASNNGAITADAHRALVAQVAKDSPGEEMAANVVAVSNLAALNQELERYGLIRRERTLPALMSAVKTLLA